MITTEGKLHIKRFMAGFESTIAQSIGFGIGATAEALTNTRLQFEVSRANINLRSFDYVTNRLIFKAPVPEDYSGYIYEVGLFSGRTDSVDWQSGARIITTFDNATELWTTNAVPSTFVASGSRVGDLSLYHNPATGTTQTSLLSGIYMDMANAADTIVLAFNVENAFTSALTLRFLNDTTNYFQANLGAQSAGYKIVEFPKSSAAGVGAPRWEEITGIEVASTATGGTGGIAFDALRVETNAAVSSTNILVAREVLATPFFKQNGKVQEIEFGMEVNL